MFTIRETLEFSNWLDRLRDQRAKARIAERVGRLAAGNPGDVKSVGEGVSELRIDYGPGIAFISFAKVRSFMSFCVAGIRARRNETFASQGRWQKN